MPKKREEKTAAHAADRDALVAIDAVPRVSLKELRKGAHQTQEDMAAALDVGQDTVSRLEKRSDMLLSTLRHFVECTGGQLTLVVTFPDQPPVVIDPVGGKKKAARKRSRVESVVHGHKA